MNLSDDTSRDSSVRIGDEDNDILAGHHEVNLSVSSNEQIGQNEHGENNQDFLAENQRLLEENNALRQRIAELDGGGGRESDFKPQPQLSEEWKRIRTGGIVTEIDRLAGDHHTSAVTISANIMKRKARVLNLTDINTVAKRIEEGLPVDSHKMPILVATWLCVRSKRTGLGQKAYRKIKTVFRRYNLCRLPSHYTVTTFWRKTILIPIQLSAEGSSQVFPSDNRPQYILYI